MIEIIKSTSDNAELLYEKMPSKIKGCIIICAGGGYEWLSPREEWPVANRFAQAGYQAYILKYSVTCGSDHAGIKPLMQLAWAVKRVREIQRKPVYVCGFSAGGHLCASLGVHWNDKNMCPYEEQELIRPDGMILGYSVLDINAAYKEFGEVLCGNDIAMKQYLNPVGYVSKETPPAFLWHTATDELVSVKMSFSFAQRLIDCNVPVELHVFPVGKHGLSTASPDVDEPIKGRLSDSHISEWISLCIQWLEQLG